jgi:hypothetical protein
MDVIKSVDHLPKWFKEAQYHKNLSAADWYREIRKRDWVREKIRTAVEKADMPPGRPLSLFRACYAPLKRSWELYYQYGVDAPIADMTKAQAIFLAACNDSDAAQNFFTASRGLISHYRHELTKNKESASPEYEDHLSYFLDDWHNTNYPHLDDMAYRIVHNDGNSMLDYCRPFEGYPIVVDTAFDDETILNEFKRWLAEVRKHDEPKAKRPFSQNDFSDWANYRLREIHDLDMWSSLVGVKIQDRVVAQALWPHATDSFSPLDVLRTTARKKVKDIFTSHVSRRLYGQLVLENGEYFLEE